MYDYVRLLELLLHTLGGSTLSVVQHSVLPPRMGGLLYNQKTSYVDDYCAFEARPNLMDQFLSLLVTGLPLQAQISCLPSPQQPLHGVSTPTVHYPRSLSDRFRHR